MIKGGYKNQRGNVRGSDDEDVEGPVNSNYNSQFNEITRFVLELHGSMFW